MKNYILFDFDGTVFDTAEGITKCVQYALGKMGIEAGLNELMCFAGPPLVEMFMQKYGMSKQDA
ncbi:MAG: HAD hydrolase-like protein, partial [Oscillospiraceae bacterium]